MPELMRTLVRRINTGSCQRVLNDRSNGFLPLKLPHRRYATQKYRAACTVRSALLQVVGDRLTHIGRKRHGASLSALTVHIQTSVMPIDVVQFERDDFACAQT